LHVTHIFDVILNFKLNFDSALPQYKMS